MEGASERSNNLDTCDKCNPTLSFFENGCILVEFLFAGLSYLLRVNWVFDIRILATGRTFIYSKSTIETLEKGVKYVQS